MTLTVRSASVTGATTASRALTHAEMDENWNHVANFTQSGTGVIGTETLQTVLRRITHSAQFDTSANFNTATDALTGTLGVPNMRFGGGTWTFGSNLVATRDGGVVQGNPSLTQLTLTCSGHSDGTGNPLFFDVEPSITGSNNLAAASGIVCHLYNSGTGTVAAMGAVSASPRVNSNGDVTNATAFNAAVHLISGSGNISIGACFQAKTQTMTGSGSITTLSGFEAQDMGHATQVANVYGLLVRNQTEPTTLAAAVRSLVAAGTNKYGLYFDGTAPNYLAGILGVGTTPSTTAYLNLAASGTSTTSLRIPHGTAPSSPVNGDIWTTSSGLFVRVNGVTVGPLS